MIFDEEPYKIIKCCIWAYDAAKDRVEIKYNIDLKDESKNVSSIVLFDNKVILEHKDEIVDVIHESRYIVCYKSDLVSKKN